MRRLTRRLAILGPAAAALCAMSGCLERRLYITSEPPGALVRLNDVDMGRTPLEVDFEWYGTYDVRLELDGYEPLSTSQKADAPIQEWPGIDLIAMAIPAKFKNDVRWHFELEPESLVPADAIARGRELRAMMTAAQAPEAPEDAVEVEATVVEEEVESFPPLVPEEAAPPLEPETAPLESPPAPEN